MLEWNGGSTQERKNQSLNGSNDGFWVTKCVKAITDYPAEPILTQESGRYCQNLWNSGDMTMLDHLRLPFGKQFIPL